MTYKNAEGRAPHGARGLKHSGVDLGYAAGSRAPHGARGLKHFGKNFMRLRDKSRPARGAWIETRMRVRWSGSPSCRAPHGARGLKQAIHRCHRFLQRRAPHGARGLKHPPMLSGGVGRARRAPHGARGLKLLVHPQSAGHGLSRPARGAWIETMPVSRRRGWSRSRPARGAWIETYAPATPRRSILVAPRTGRVD